MRKYLLLILPLFFYCADRKIPESPELETSAEIREVKIPASLNPGNSYMISAKIENLKVAHLVDYISLKITVPNSGTPLQEINLYDDGGAVYPQDEDVIAKDGIYSNKFAWQSDNSAQKFTFIFAAHSALELDIAPLEKQIDSFINSLPAIISVEMPDILPDGFDDEKLIKVTATDSNGIDDLDRVTFRAFPADTSLAEFSGQLLDNGESGDATANDGIFTLAVTNLFSVGKRGDYDFNFVAIDKSSGNSAEIIRKITILNSPPVLSNLAAPDTVQRPPKDYIVRYLATLNVDDKQSIFDIKTVKVEWQKPDSTFSENSPFELFDNGLPFDIDQWDSGYRGDEIEGDGVFSISIIFDDAYLPDENGDILNPLGDYKLTFWAEDWSGNQSEKIVHIIHTFAPESL